MWKNINKGKNKETFTNTEYQAQNGQWFLESYTRLKKKT